MNCLEHRPVDLEIPATKQSGVQILLAVAYVVFFV